LNDFDFLAASNALNHDNSSENVRSGALAAAGIWIGGKAMQKGHEQTLGGSSETLNFH
jgi:hypothetical protein